MNHAVSRLRSVRLAASTKPFLARGSGGGRCAACRLVASHCVCALRPLVAVRSGVCLIMGDIEALKPSNTGWLIADLVPDTWPLAGRVPALTPPCWPCWPIRSGSPIWCFPGSTSRRSAW